MDCPNCGVVDFGGSCSACGHTVARTLAFVRSDGVVVPIGRAALMLTQAWGLRFVGDEARCWSPEGQFTVAPEGAHWVLRHNDRAPNETLVHGRRVEAVTLTEGDVVSVGREATRVMRTPLIVKFL